MRSKLFIALVLAAVPFMAAARDTITVVKSNPALCAVADKVAEKCAELRKQTDTASGSISWATAP